MSNFVDCDRDQAFLLPPDLRDWIPSDDLAHFVIEAVERVDLDAFKVNHRGTGSAQYHPRMMLALLIYCYANGIFSSRRIEAGDAPRYRGSLRCGEPSPRPRYDRALPAGKLRCGVGELLAGSASGQGVAAVARGPGERRRLQVQGQREQASFGDV